MTPSLAVAGAAVYPCPSLMGAGREPAIISRIIFAFRPDRPAVAGESCQLARQRSRSADRKNRAMPNLISMLCCARIAGAMSYRTLDRRLWT